MSSIPSVPMSSRDCAANGWRGSAVSLLQAGFSSLAVPASDGGCGGPAVVQALLQFICGYYDADLRDATGLGHGRLIAKYATAQSGADGCPG